MRVITTAIDAAMYLRCTSRKMATGKPSAMRDKGSVLGVAR
jgi:hypothetical protein